MMEILERPRAVLEHQPEANHDVTLERDRMAAEQSTQTTPERWLPVPGYEGYCEVSDHGRVRSLERVIQTKNGPQRHPEKLRKLYYPESSGGYAVVGMYVGGERLPEVCPPTGPGSIRRTVPRWYGGLPQQR